MRATIREYAEEVKELLAFRIDANLAVKEVEDLTTIYIKSHNAGRHYCLNGEYDKKYSIDECADHIVDLHQMIREAK